MRQRNQRLSLRARPLAARAGWMLTVDGEESSILETIDRRTLQGRALLGRRLTWRQLDLFAEAGVLTSQHRSVNSQTDEAGLARNVGAVWRPALRLAGQVFPTRTEASIAHSGDTRADLRSDQTDWRWDSEWVWPDDSLSLRWDEGWHNTRFYPSPDEFESIAQQQRRQRVLDFSWGHAGDVTNTRSLPSLMSSFAWHVNAHAGLDDNTYKQVTDLAPGSLLPRDTRSSERGYTLGASRAVGPAQATVEYRYRWTQDRFGEQRRDQTAETGEIEGRLTWRVTAMDSVALKAIFRVTSYTAPRDSSFYEDRDQAERVIEVSWKRDFSSVFFVRPVFSFRGYRQIFISERLSANNNTDDVYLLAPEIQWLPFKAVTVFQRVAIRAHYRFNEYTRSDPEGGGTLYRRAESESRMGIRQSPRVHWNFRYLYRYEDFGGLYDRDGWVQSVDWDRRSHLIDGRVEWRPFKGLVIEPNLGLEFKRAYQHRREAGAIVRVKDEPFRRHYIAMNVHWYTSAGFLLDFSVARRVQQFGGSAKDRDDRWTINLSRYLP